jgi:hypothetical protein
MDSLDTVVLGGATHRESGFGSNTEVLTITPGVKLIMLPLWYQNTYSGCFTLSLNSQVIVTLLPRFTCFSREPRIFAVGSITQSHEDKVLTPDGVAAWHWYPPWSLCLTDCIWSVHSDPPGECRRLKRLSVVKVLRPLVRI